MGPNIIIPTVALLLIVPLVIFWAKRRFVDNLINTSAGGAIAVAPASRLTSNALRELPSPPWRVVYEISPDRMSGIEHVLLGPAGAFPLRTELGPMPDGATERQPSEIAQASIVRGGLDDALMRSHLSSDTLVLVYWGPPGASTSCSVDLMHGVIAVDGRRLDEWAASLDTRNLTESQVDLAWSTILQSIGRPNPFTG